jgi:ABC-2 type transport system permease protein
MRSILFMLRKEFLQIFRIREMIAIIFGMPVIQMVILGFALTNEVKDVSLIIADQDNSAYSHELIRAFGNTDRFDLIGVETDLQRIRDDIHSWKAQMALVIPVNFGRDLQNNSVPQIQLIVDGLDGNTAGIALSYASGILSKFGSELFADEPLRQIAVKSSHNVSAVMRMWYNLNLDNAQYMIPGVVVLLLTIISMMLSAISLVREKEIGTLEQLMVTPLRKHQLLLGKIIPFWLLSFLEMGVVMFMAGIIFSIHIQGSFIVLGALVFIYLFTTLGLGIFVSTISATQQQAMFISWFFMLFLMLMSGFFIPIENMPEIMKQITYLNPMRYMMYIMRDVVQKGSGIMDLLSDAIPMTLYGIAIFTMGVIKFRKRVS